MGVGEVGGLASSHGSLVGVCASYSAPVLCGPDVPPLVLGVWCLVPRGVELIVLSWAPGLRVVCGVLSCALPVWWGVWLRRLLACALLSGLYGDVTMSVAVAPSLASSSATPSAVPGAGYKKRYSFRYLAAVC